MRKEGCNLVPGPPAAHLGPAQYSFYLAQGQALRAECGWGVCKLPALIHLSAYVGAWGSQVVTMSF